ncbi:MAG: toll/interleukin-1 receptor domain-containing protein [Opitutus sp.]
MNGTSKAVFLSYASRDSEAAKRICESLRASGVEVWFDQSELVGGDAWDAKIRGQISSCALFVPVISAATQARLEGYFRREGQMAVERMHDMDDHLPFLVPIGRVGQSRPLAFAKTIRYARRGVGRVVDHAATSAPRSRQRSSR